jgi:hypothetical protein
MWTILGNPFSSSAVPYWPVGPTPALSSSSSNTDSSLYAISLKLKKWIFNEPDHKAVNIRRTLKLRSILLNAEDSVYISTNILLQQWRKTHPTVDEMLKTENSLAEYTYLKLLKTYAIFSKELTNN